MRKFFTYLFYILFAASVVIVSIFEVPKYAEYRDGNTKQRMNTGFYAVNQTTVRYRDESYTGDIIVYPDGSQNNDKELSLTVDYAQWGILVFTSAAVFLMPALLLNHRHYR